MQRAWRWWSVVAGALVVSRAHPPDLLVAGATPGRAAVRASSGRGVASLSQPRGHAERVGDHRQRGGERRRQAGPTPARKAPCVLGRRATDGAPPGTFEPPARQGALPAAAFSLRPWIRQRREDVEGWRGGGTCEQLLVAALRFPSSRAQGRPWDDHLAAWIGGGDPL